MLETYAFCIFDTNASSANLVSVGDDDYFHIRGFHLRDLCVSKTVTDFLGCLSTLILNTYCSVFFILKITSLFVMMIFSIFAVST